MNRVTDPACPRELVYFLMLTPDEQRAAVTRMAGAGWSDHGIASATRQSVEAVRRILGANEAVK
jgi:hypothetical protein